MSRRPRRRRALLLALVGLVLTCASSAAGAGGERPDSGIEGKIRIWGKCYSGPEPYTETCHSSPCKATVRVRRARDREEVTRFTSRKRDGYYRVRLVPGRYILDTRRNACGIAKGSLRVRVRKHEFAEQDIAYDGGIL